jgi:hypothetical protein
MKFTDLKIYALNSTSLAVSFTSIDDFLKILLLSVSIGYTFHKWLLMHNQNKND